MNSSRLLISRVTDIGKRFDFSRRQADANLVRIDDCYRETRDCDVRRFANEETTSIERLKYECPKGAPQPRLTNELIIHGSLPQIIVLHGQSLSLNEIYLVSKYASSPSWPNSRPRPDSFMPPKGHCGVAGTGSLMPMMPASRPSAIFQAAERSLVKT